MVRFRKTRKEGKTGKIDDEESIVSEKTPTNND
jgi:hypothetical protein